MLGRELLFALIGTGATFLATALGAAMVFLFRKDMSPKLQQIFLGFAAGVMTAAAVFSLLMPAIETLEEQGKNVLLPVGGGFALGALFLLVLDRVLPHMHIGSDEPEGLCAHFQKTTMLVFAVTLHNIPEGMAVGLAFAAAAQSTEAGALAGAIALAVGMGLQNFPEGGASWSRFSAFWRCSWRARLRVSCPGRSPLRRARWFTSSSRSSFQRRT